MRPDRRQRRVCGLGSGNSGCFVNEIFCRPCVTYSTRSLRCCWARRASRARRRTRTTRTRRVWSRSFARLAPPRRFLVAPMANSASSRCTGIQQGCPLALLFAIDLAVDHRTVKAAVPGLRVLAIQVIYLFGTQAQCLTALPLHASSSAALPSQSRLATLAEFVRRSKRAVNSASEPRSAPLRSIQPCFAFSSVPVLLISSL